MQISNNRPIYQTMCATTKSPMMSFSVFLGFHFYSWYGSRYFVEKPSQFGFCKRYHETLWHVKIAAFTSEKKNFPSMKTKLMSLLQLSTKDYMIPAVFDKYGKLDCLWKCNKLSPNLYALCSDFFKLGFNPYKADQPLRGMELQEK